LLTYVKARTTIGESYEKFKSNVMKKVQTLHFLKVSNNSKRYLVAFVWRSLGKIFTSLVRFVIKEWTIKNEDMSVR